MADDNDWQRSGEDDKPSYLGAMLTSPANVNAAMLSVIAAAGLSLPFGLIGAALPLLAFGAGEAIAALFVPSSPTFRHRVDRRHRAERRGRAIMHLRQEIENRVSQNHPTWNVFARMRQRIDSLQEIARHRGSSLGDGDIERLEDTCVDFLGLWLADLSMSDRLRSVSTEDLEKRIAGIAKRIEAGDPDRRSLVKAKSDLDELLLRQRRLASRKAAVEAALLALPDAVEEIYHAVITTPSSGAVGNRLQEAIDRLRLEEELEHTYTAELDEALPRRAARAMAQARH